jgi:thiosulfate dehydrogenase
VTQSRAILATLGAIAGLVLCACSSETHPYDPSALPTGAEGMAIVYGHTLMLKTDTLMRGYVRAHLTCADCHVGAGTKARGGSFVGTYARFPQWNARAHRMIALQDRIAECFLYSMNGKAPAYSSKQMIAMVAYIAWLSRGTPVGATQPKSDSFLEPLPSAPPDLARGQSIYREKCAQCHGVFGRGLMGAFPPLWGRDSFNDGAGMSHLNRMTGFVRYNMPYGAPGSLSLQEAYDVAAFVLSHPRPHFHRNALQRMRPLPARYF